jgi:sortase (surface protein transpeptidase)
MKKIIIIAGFIILGILLALGFNNFQKNSNPPSTVSQTPSVTKVQTSTIKVGAPKRIIIPKLDVNANIESVTTDSQGRMDIPKNFYDTAWYSKGAKPGQQGSAVIDGHVDTPQGTPSVFADIKSLTRGDLITIESSDGKKYNFSVTKVMNYPLETIPLNLIFDLNTRDKRLNLITCSGTWDRETKNYSNRLVVYSVLIDSN